MVLLELRDMSVKFSVLVERDEDGYYIASVPELPGCHTQARTLDELTGRVKQAIELYLETEGTKTEGKVELVGVQFVEVPAK
jgi:predicted RNase H-like HicB family nuclease